MSKRNQGIMLAIIGTMFWGISSPFAQALFAQNVKPLWLVGARLLLAGILLSVWGFIATDKEQHKEIFKKKNLILLILFAVFGMVPSQLTFFLAIRYGNASTATILQFLGPVFIIVCLAIQYRKLPPRIDVISLMIAVLGTILVVTNGKIGTLALSAAGIFWGIMAGVSQASYTLIPRRLLEQFDARLVTGLGMFIGSILFWPLILTTKIPSITPFTVGSFAYIIIFGTMASYLCYLQSVKYIPASTTGMLSAFEPLTANVLSVLWFHETLGTFQTLGAFLILSTAFLQAMALKGK